MIWTVPEVEALVQFAATEETSFSAKKVAVSWEIVHVGDGKKLGPEIEVEEVGERNANSIIRSRGASRKAVVSSCFLYWLEGWVYDSKMCGRMDVLIVLTWSIGGIVLCL